MKLHSNMLAAVSIVLHFAIFITIFPKSILGHELFHRSSNGGDRDDTTRDVPIIEQDDSEMHTQKLASRLLDLDTSTSCSNACDADQLKQFRAPFLEVEIVDEEESSNNHGFFSHLFGHISGLFQFFNRRGSDSDDRKEYMIPTEPIVELLSNSSSKIMSLIDVLRLEGVKTDSSTTSEELVTKLYDLSAENMESVVSLIDMIVTDVQQSSKIDIRTLGCHMQDLINLLHNITLPNIEFLAQSAYTNSNESDLKYAMTIPSTSTLVVSENRNAFECADYYETSSVSSSPATSMARRFNDMDLASSITGRQSTDVSPTLLELILFFPLSLVLSIIGIIASIVVVPATLLIFLLIALLPGIGPLDYITLSIGLSAIFAIIVSVLAPIRIIILFIDRIVSIFNSIFPPDEMMTSPPTTTTSVLEEVTMSHNIQSHLLAVLNSPLDDIKAFIFQNTNTHLRGIDGNGNNDKNYNGNDDQTYDMMECELAMFQCHTTALMDVLPFLKKPVPWYYEKKITNE